MEVKDKMYDQYKGIAFHIASKYINKYRHFILREIDDIKQEAVLALLIAIKDRKKVRKSFSSYAYITIHNAVKSYIANLVKHRNLYIEDLDLKEEYGLHLPSIIDFSDEEKAMFTYRWVEGHTIDQTARKFKMRKEVCLDICEQLRDAFIKNLTNNLSTRFD